VATVLRNLRIKRVAIVDKGANFDPETGDGAHILLYKRDLRKTAGPSLGDVHVPVAGSEDDDQRDEYEKATLTSGQRNALPDSAFAAVWTDGKGKKQRKLPYKHPDGSIDTNHLGAARGRIDATPMPPDVKTAARAKLDAAAKENSSVAKQKQNTFLKRLTQAIAKAFPPAEKPGLDVAKANEELQTMQAHHAALGKVIDQHTAAVGGDASKLPADHPVHQLKALHAQLGKSIEENQAKIAAATPPEGGDELDPLDGIAEDPDECDPEDGEGDDVNAAAPAMAKRIEKRLRTTFEKQMVDLKKTADDAVKRAEAVEKAAAAERDIRDREGVRAELTKFRGVSVDLEKDVEPLLRLKKSDPEAYARTISILSGADAQVRESALFKHYGSGSDGGTGAGSAWAEIERLAEKIVEKRNGKELTPQQKIAKVLENPANRKLVKRYYEEQAQ